MRNGRTDSALAAGLVAGAILVAARVEACKADDFSAYQHDAQRTGLSSSVLNPTTLTTTWTSPGFGSPLIVGGNVFGNSASQIASFNIANGQVNWISAGSGSPIAYGGGFIAQTYGAVAGSQIQPSLRVFDASTGAAKYSLAIAAGPGVPITIARDVTTNQQVAYIADAGGNCTAVRLGAASGTVLWTATGLLAGGGPSSVIGNYLILANVGQYYAINRTTGAVNNFFTTSTSGGLVYSPVVDLARNQFYIDSGGTVTAYSLSTGGTINQLWQKSSSGIGSGVALDANGNLYSASTSALIKMDPITGNTLLSTAGTFARGTTPIISGNTVWDFAPGRFGILDQSLVAYDLGTLQFVTSFTEVPNVSASTYNGASALDNTHFVFDEGVSNGSFIVSTGISLPEPASLTLLVPGVVVLLARRRRTAGRVPLSFVLKGP